MRGHEEPSNPPTSQSARRTLGDLTCWSRASASQRQLPPSVTRDSTSRISCITTHPSAPSGNLRRVRGSAARSDRLWHIHDLAASVIETSLDEGDPRIALEIFKHLARGVTGRPASCGGLVSFRDRGGGYEGHRGRCRCSGGSQTKLPSGDHVSRLRPGVAKTEGGLKQHQESEARSLGSHDRGSAIASVDDPG